MESDHFTNLTQHRSDVDAWASRGRWYRVADDQIVLSLASIAGVALLLYGATRRRSNPGVWWLVGGAVVGCAAVSLRSGQWLQSTRGWLQNTRFGSRAALADVVTEESVDSFPASDAPSSNATTASVQPLPSHFGRSGDA